MTQEFLNDYDDKVIALAKHLELELEIDEADFEDEEEKEKAIQSITNDLDNITNDYGNEYSYGNQDFLVLTDEEADEEEDRQLDNYLEDCILCELPENVRYYFDDEKWKDDAKIEGRGHIISTYDGCEYWETVNGVTYYIYRIN